MALAHADSKRAQESHDASVDAESDSARHSLGTRLLVVALILGIWVAARLVCWVGYAGADDQYYARYAYLMHRLPFNHMECRMPVIFAIRAAILAFGPSETAVCMAPMFFSAMLLAAVAWFVGWPKTLTWKSNVSVLLAGLMPLDVVFASYPSPAALSAGLAALGMACVLKGNRFIGLIGGLLLGVAFMTHFLNFFFVGLFCLATLAIDWRKYWIPIVGCICISGGLLAAEMATYGYLADNPKLRFDTLSSLGSEIPDDGRSESKLGFFFMPLQILVLSKQFSFGLLLVAAGVLVYKRLSIPQRIVWVTTIGFWFWLGFGTVTPFAYRPATRGMHYYTPLLFGICTLVPVIVELLFARWPRLGKSVLVLLLLSCLGSLSLGGQWGSQVECSRQLLKYAQAHPDERFLTDVYTLNEMYMANRFQLPDNVVVLDSLAQRKHLLPNKEPAGHKPISFLNPARVDAILVNLSRGERPPEEEFTDFLESHHGKSVHQIAPRYRLLFVPFQRWLMGKEFALRNRGAEVLQMPASSNASPL